MTLKEFKCWLEGYMEDKPGSPNAKEWEKIKEKMDKVEAEPCKRDHYWPWINPIYPYTPSPIWDEGTGTAPSWKWNDTSDTWIIETGTTHQEDLPVTGTTVYVSGDEPLGTILV